MIAQIYRPENVIVIDLAGGEDSESRMSYKSKIVTLSLLAGVILGAFFFLASNRQTNYTEASISSIKPKQTLGVRTFASYSRVSRESMITSAPLIIAGEVTEITPTRWNQDSGKQWEPTDWDTATTTPLTLYEIEVKIEKSIVNELKLKSPVRLTIIGGSPVDSADSDIDAKVSDKVMVFARQTELVWQDGKRSIIQLLGAPGAALLIQDKDSLYYSRLRDQEPLSLDNLERQVAESRVAEKSEE